MTDITPTNTAHKIDLFTLRVVRNAKDLNEMREGLLALGSEFGFEVTTLRITARPDQPARLILNIERKDGVEMGLDIDLYSGLAFVGVYVKWGQLAYIAELPAEMVEMLSTPPTVVAREAPRLRLVLPDNAR